MLQDGFIEMPLTLSRARSAMPHIFAIVDSEYKDASVSLIVGSNSNVSDTGGVNSPSSSRLSGGCFGSMAICYLTVSQGIRIEKYRRGTN
jgi:hypothetical protein